MTSNSDIVGTLFTHSVIFLCPPVGVLGPLGSVGEARTPPLPSGTLPSLLHLHMMEEDENRQVYSMEANRGTFEGEVDTVDDCGHKSCTKKTEGGVDEEERTTPPPITSP